MNNETMGLGRDAFAPLPSEEAGLRPTWKAVYTIVEVPHRESGRPLDRHALTTVVHSVMSRPTWVVRCNPSIALVICPDWNPSLNPGEALSDVASTAFP